MVIPVKNGMPFIKKSVATALKELPADGELIIRNNCSTDGTSEWLMALRDARLHVVHAEEPVSAAENWDAVIGLARGKYLKLLCADDSIAPGGLNRQLIAAESHQAVMVASRRKVVTSDGRTLLRSHGLPREFVGVTSGQVALKNCVLTGTNVFGEPSAVLFRTDVVRAAGHFDDEYPYLIDLDFYARVLQHGDVVGLNSVDAEFRVSANSWSSQIGREQRTEFINWVSKMIGTKRFSLSDSEQLRVRRAIRNKFRWRRVLSGIANSLLVTSRR